MRILVTLLCSCIVAKAAIINSPSCSQFDVSNSISKSSPGDTVVLPIGNASWTTNMLVMGITLQGQGTNFTVIHDETPLVGGGGNNFQVMTLVTTNIMTRVTGIQFAQGITNNDNTQNGFKGNISVTGGNPLWKIDNCFFNLLTAKSIEIDGDCFGVIQNCTMLTFGRQALEVFGNGFGDTDWTNATTWGSTNAVYVESCYFYDQSNFGSVDVSDGGRLVFRYNTSQGCYFNTHGLETSQRNRSARYCEIYNNNYYFKTNLAFQNFFTGCDVRGGSYLVFSNLFYGYNNAVLLECYRATDNDPGFQPWFGMCGTNSYDSNGPALFSGTTLVYSNKLVITGGGLSPNFWIGMSVFNSNKDLCGIVTGNTTNAFSFRGSRNGSLQIQFTNGDHYYSKFIYPSVDQIGRGQGLMMDNEFTPTNTWLSILEALEPCYFWSNTVFAMQEPFGIIIPVALDPTVGNNGYGNIQAGRDFFNTIKPGYTPFQFPYPGTLPPFTNAVAANGLLGRYGHISVMH